MVAPGLRRRSGSHRTTPTTRTHRSPYWTRPRRPPVPPPTSSLGASAGRAGSSGAEMRLNETYQFSPAVLRALHHYDSALRVRWGRQERCVRVERRVRRGRDVNPATCRAHFDDYEAARDGYACVYKLHPGQEHALLARLVADDLWRRGGAGRVPDHRDRATLDREGRGAPPPRGLPGG